MDVFGFGVAGDIVNNLVNIFIIIASVALVGGVLAVLYFSGIFGKKPHNVMVALERAGGSLAFYPTKGNFKKAAGEGNFEIHDGLFKRISVQAPTEDFIYFGDWIFFYRRAKEDYRPVKISVNPENLELDPALQPAMKLALAAQTEKSALRFQAQNQLIQMMPVMAILIAAVILGLAFIIGIGAANEPSLKTAAAFQAVADKMAGAQVLLDYTNHTAGTVTTASAYYPPG